MAVFIDLSIPSSIFARSSTAKSFCSTHHRLPTILHLSKQRTYICMTVCLIGVYLFCVAGTSCTPRFTLSSLIIHRSGFSAVVLTQSLNGPCPAVFCMRCGSYTRLSHSFSTARTTVTLIQKSMSVSGYASDLHSYQYNGFKTRMVWKSQGECKHWLPVRIEML